MSNSGVLLNIGPLGGDGQRRVLFPVRGRSAELAVIDEAIAAAADGRAGVLVLEGPPGIGKSRLLAEVERRAEGAVSGRYLVEASSISNRRRSIHCSRRRCTPIRPSVMPKRCAAWGIRPISGIGSSMTCALASRKRLPGSR